MVQSVQVSTTADPVIRDAYAKIRARQETAVGHCLSLMQKARAAIAAAEEESERLRKIADKEFDAAQEETQPFWREIWEHLHAAGALPSAYDSYGNSNFRLRISAEDNGVCSVHVEGKKPFQMDTAQIIPFSALVH